MEYLRPCFLNLRFICVGLLLLLAADQGKTLSGEKVTVVFPPLTVIQVRSLVVFCSALNDSHTATVLDSSSGINFQFTLAAYGTFRRLFTSSYREKSFAVFPLTQGFHVYAKWGIAIANTDAFSVFNDVMLGTSYVISTWTDCCNATSFILVSALDNSGTTVTITPPRSSSATLTAGGQDYTAEFTLQLGLREVVTITSTSDLSGAAVRGDNSILVQSGSTRAAVRGTTKGQLLETLPPVTHQGSLHFGVPSTGRSSDVYRIVSSFASNTVTVKEDGVLITTVTLTSANPVYDYVATNPVVITSSDPLLVTMFSSSEDASGIPPAMTFIPSTSHWASYYVIREADATFARPEYVTLVIMTSYTSGVQRTYSDQSHDTVDGWSSFLSDVSYAYVTLPITRSFVLQHVSEQPFMVIQYGVKANWAYSFVPVFTHTVTPDTTTTATTDTATTDTDTITTADTITTDTDTTAVTTDTATTDTDAITTADTIATDTDTTAVTTDATDTDTTDTTTTSVTDSATETTATSPDDTTASSSSSLSSSSADVTTEEDTTSSAATTDNAAPTTNSTDNSTDTASSSSSSSWTSWLGDATNQAVLGVGASVAAVAVAALAAYKAVLVTQAARIAATTATSSLITSTPSTSSTSGASSSSSSSTTVSGNRSHAEAMGLTRVET